MIARASLLILAAVLVLLGGCSTNQEDRDFFEHGWLYPERASNERMAKP